MVVNSETFNPRIRVGPSSTPVGHGDRGVALISLIRGLGAVNAGGFLALGLFPFTPLRLTVFGFLSVSVLFWSWVYAAKLEER